MIIIVIITVVIGIQVLAIWYLIRNKLMTGILSGHNNKVKDKEGMLEEVGNNLLLMGTLAFLSGGLQIIFPGLQAVFFLIYVLVIVPALGLKIFLGIKKHEKRTS